MTKGTVLYDPTAPAAVPVVEAPAAKPAKVEGASSEVGLKPGTKPNPVTEVTVHQEVGTMFTKNLEASISGSTLTLKVVDPAARLRNSASGKSAIVAQANGLVNIGDGLRVSIVISKDGAKV